MRLIRSLLGVAGIAVALAAGFAASSVRAQETGTAAADEAVSVNELMDRTIALVEAGRLAEAEPVARQAVAAARGLFGENHPDTGIAMAELAGILHRLERLEEAERLYRRILGIFETAAPDDGLGLATALNNLAEALRRLNRLDEAEETHRRALALYERILPEGHPDIGGSLNNLASTVQQAGRFGEAEEMFRRALAIREAALPESDPLVALSLTNLAVVLQHLNALDEAERLTEAPQAGWRDSDVGRTQAYREAKWLFRSHPSITVLPTLASLRALRSTAPERTAADRAFLGVGDPVIGRNAAERDAPPMDCGAPAPVLVADAGPALARQAGAAPAALFAGATDDAGFGLADAGLVRSQPRLADTRCELAAVAASLGEAGGTDLLFGADATEARLRELDAGGELSRYRVLHFATHGLLGGEMGFGEPGLVLTPPETASAHDDGILTASEIATLTLAADWVVLSACNTAAGSEADAEALSGLARSFFYAGARSLLVSSWPVYSPAAVELTTRAFATMAEDPRLGRAEALAIAMRETLAGARTEQAAHPSYWGPFFLVGEGEK